MSTAPSPPLAPTVALVVCERTQRWAAAARQAKLGAKVVETRTTDDAWRELANDRHGVLLIECDASRAPQVVALLARVQAELPEVLVVAGASEPSAEWEMLLREAGAAAVLASPRRVAEIAPWLARHLAAAPVPEISVRERVWQSLPWPAVPLKEAMEP
jgi:hypothetical protein